MELDNDDGNVETKSPQKEETSVGFTVLAAGTQYTVRVFTLSGGPASVKMEGKFYTSKSGGNVYFLNDFVYIQHCYKSYSDLSRHWSGSKKKILSQILHLKSKSYQN